MRTGIDDRHRGDGRRESRPRSPGRRRPRRWRPRRPGPRPPDRRRPPLGRWWRRAPAAGPRPRRSRPPRCDRWRTGGGGRSLGGRGHRGAAGGGGGHLGRARGRRARGGPAALQALHADEQGLDRRLELGRGGLDRASSSWVRGSAPSFIARRPAASRSSSRTTLGGADARGLLEQPHVLVGDTRSSSGTSSEPIACRIISPRRWASRSPKKRPTSRPEPARRSAASSASRASPAATASTVPNSRSASAAPSTASTSSSATVGPRVGQQLLERPERVAEASRSPSGRSAPAPRRRSRSPRRRPPAPSTPAIWATVGRAKSKRWQRSTTVGSTLAASVVASTKIVCGGGSSSVLRNAFHAAVESMCASSRM